MRAIVLGKAERWGLLGIPVLFFVGSLFHFLYGLSGENFLVGLLTPVNESVWEHLKLVLLPMTLWWVAGYFRLRRGQELDTPAWFCAAFVAIFTAMAVIAVLFYFYTGAFGADSLVADIGLFLLAVLLGQWAGVRVYQQGSALSAVVPVAGLIALLVLFILFTLAPPNLPLFVDPISGTRGIFQIT
jgi:hypothetical protein